MRNLNYTKFVNIFNRVFDRLLQAAEKFELGRDNKNDRIDDVSAVDFDRSTGLVVSLYAQVGKKQWRFEF